MKKRVSVVIPIYKDKLSEYEQISLERCLDVLRDFPIIAVTPHSLNLSGISSKYGITNIKTFDDGFFKNINGYNRLMLADTFYKAFLEYEYILIYQLDSFVLYNNLNLWCSENYDYIGAPWLVNNEKYHYYDRLKVNVLKKFHTIFNCKQPGENFPSYDQFENTVGNGGVSLRRVSKFYEICLSHKKVINYYNQQEHHHYNEDSFWSIEVNRVTKRLRIPSVKIAAEFSFENLPDYALHLTNGKLPFCCHDWDEHLDFWRPLFKEHGYII